MLPLTRRCWIGRLLGCLVKIDGRIQY